MTVPPRTAGVTEGPSTPAPHGRHELLLLILVGALWGSAFPVIRVGIVAGAPPLVFASARYAITASILVPIALGTRAPRPPPAQLLRSAVFGGLFIIGLYGALLYLGEDQTSGGFAAVLAASATLWSLVFGLALLHREPLARREVTGLVVGFLGVAVLVLPQLTAGPTTTLLGSLLVLGAVVSFSAGAVLLRRTVTLEPSVWTLTAQFAVAAALVGSFALAIGEPRTLGNVNRTLPALAYLVAAPSILGYVLYFRLHHRVGPTRANLVVYVGPIAAVIVGVAAFGEGVSVFEVAGLALIAGGLYVVQRAPPPKPP